MTITIKVTDAAGNSTTKTTNLVVETAPDTGLPSPFHFVGISSSRLGLSASEDHKRKACIDRYAEFATALGITPAAMRKHGGRHVYDTTNSPQTNAMNIGVFKNCVEDGYGHVMLTTSQWTDMAGAANGNYDTTIKAFLASMSAQDIRVIWNVKHEPSNNGWGPTEPPIWRKLQARIAWLVAAHNDPNIYYSDCHIPLASDDAMWNWLPELKALRPNDWQSINDRTFLGMDPYPEVGFQNGSHVIQTLASRMNAAINFHRNAGRTGPLMLNEVGLYNWCLAHSEPGPLDAAGQAKRLHDELWTWGQVKNMPAYYYYDVSHESDADIRDTQRTLNTPQEHLEYAKLVRGDYY